MNTGYTIFPLGDSAATIDLGNTISESLNDKVISMQQYLVANPFAGQQDVIVAYSSLTLIYDPVRVRQQFRPAGPVFDWIAKKLQSVFEECVMLASTPSAVIRIPVCYAPAFAPDLAAMAYEKNMAMQAIIELHTAVVYRVYTIGFLPGFSYMAEIDEKLITQRKSTPVPVAAGSVGIAGAQTGIYPLDSPGGWHIIGRTPVKQFDAKKKELVKLKIGDRVQFYAIDEAAYRESAVS